MRFLLCLLARHDAKDQVLSISKEQIARIMGSKGNLILFLGKCSMPFEGKLESYSPFFHVTDSTNGAKKGHPKIIG